MDDSAALKPEAPPTQTPAPSLSSLRRRHSISTSVVVPAKLALLSSTTKTIYGSNSLPHQNGVAPPQLDLDLVSTTLKSCPAYTSLKDLLPASAAGIGSPTAAAAASSGYEISIRNRLVKQAAWAYLQPMSSSPGSSGPTHFFRRLCLRLSSCLAYLTQLLHRILHACLATVSR
ncbi:uncharacterized protein LOC133872813 [Alnus glutinosa]|uniref:uncharacterized protein LOC133872813 n=1 Tax=Alnus glutinosa TaxID=3517 RepID=UPI002D784846|nr:uncharacterized protein LOC133872813 [Alnus glutinosa]